MTAHHGFSRKRSLGQQAPQSAPGCVTMPAAAGDRPAETASAPASAAAAMARLLISGIGSATTGWGRATISETPANQGHLPVQADFRRQPRDRAPPPRPGASRRGRGFPDGPRRRRPRRAAGRRGAQIRPCRRNFRRQPGGGARCWPPAARRPTCVRIEADRDFPRRRARDRLAIRKRCRSSPRASISRCRCSPCRRATTFPAMLIQIRRALKPDGLFLGVMAGAGTLAELRESLLAAETETDRRREPQGDPLHRRARCRRVAAAGRLCLAGGRRGNGDRALRHDVRADGGPARHGRDQQPDRPLARPATRRLFQRAAEIYAERFSDPDGRVRASFSFVWLSGWAPDPSQQKPLKPGSAQVSLAKVLGEEGKK